MPPMMIKYRRISPLVSEQVEEVHGRPEDERAARRGRGLERLEVESVRQVVHAEVQPNPVILAAEVIGGAKRVLRERAEAREAAVLGGDGRRQVKRVNAGHARLMANLVLA